MNEPQARKLKAGDRVKWDNDPSDAGSVIDTGYLAVTIAWDNGQTGTVHIADAARIELAPSEDEQP